MIKKKFVLVFALVSVQFSVLLFVCKNPLRKPESILEKMLLEELPLGTSCELVKKFFNEKKMTHWEKNSGFIKRSVKPEVVVGVKSIRAEMGSYQAFLFRAYVSVFLGFDEKCELIDISIWKTIDAL